MPKNLSNVPGLLFWSDWGSHPHIGKAGLSGQTGFAEIVFERNESFINSIVLVPEQDRFLAVDAQHDQIFSARLDYFINFLYLAL